MLSFLFCPPRTGLLVSARCSSSPAAPGLPASPSVLLVPIGNTILDHRHHFGFGAATLMRWHLQQTPTIEQRWRARHACIPRAEHKGGQLATVHDASVDSGRMHMLLEFAPRVVPEDEMWWASPVGRPAALRAALTRERGPRSIHHQ
jgi:hypothetical protein